MRDAGISDGEVLRRSRIALGLGVGAAVLVVGAILTTRPDIGPAIERARPWIGDWWRTGEILSGGSAPIASGAAPTCISSLNRPTGTPSTTPRQPDQMHLPLGKRGAEGRRELVRGDVYQGR